MNEPNHGSRARYNKGCRCDACKDANTLYYQQRRECKSVDTLDRGKIIGFPSRDTSEHPGGYLRNDLLQSSRNPLKITPEGFLAALLEHGTKPAAAKACGITPQQVGAWCKADPDYKAAVSQLELAIAEGQLEDILKNPAAYAEGLKRPGWAQLVMFRLKKLDKSYVDSPAAVQAQINIGLSAEEVGTLVREMTDRPEVRELIRANTAKLIGQSDDRE